MSVLFTELLIFIIELTTRDMQDRLSLKFYMNWFNNTSNSALLTGKPI